MIEPSPPRKPFPRLAVLGGGISGLGCAFWLSELVPFAEVVLFEASEKLGGLIHSFRDREYLLETGPLSFPSGAPATGALIRQAGLEADCSPALAPRGLALWNGRRIIPAPKGPLDVLRRKLLSPSALLRLLAEPFIPRSSRAQDLSILEFFRRRTGDGFFESLMEPMAAGILAGDPSALSMPANLPKLHAMEQESGSLARGYWRERLRRKAAPARKGPGLPGSATTPAGCGAIIDALTDCLRRRGVDLRTSCGAQSLRRGPAGYLLRAGSSPDTREEGFDGVISALPSRALATLDAAWPGAVKEFLDGVPQAPIGLVYIAFHKASRRRDFPCDGLLPQPKAGEDFLSGFLPSRMAAGRCPADQDLLRILLGGARKPHLARLDPAQAEALAIGAAKRVFGVSGSPAYVNSIRHGGCLPQLVVGHLEALDRSRHALRQAWPGFFLAGTSCQGPGIENALLSGRLAATEAANHFHTRRETAGKCHESR